MVFGNGDVYLVISKVQRKFTIAPKLIVLPSLDIVVDRQAWKKLRDDIGAVIVFFEIFVSRARAVGHVVIDFVPPFDRKCKLFSAFQWRGEVYPHHGLVDRMTKGSPCGIFHRFDVESTDKFIASKIIHEGFYPLELSYTGWIFRRFHIVFIANVLIQLHPEIRQSIGRIVGVGNGFIARETRVGVV